MRKIFALAMLLSVAFAYPASAQTAQEFLVSEFAKANKGKRYVDPVSAYFVKPTTRAVRQTARQFEPRQIERNTRAVIRAPIDATKMIFDGIDRAGQFLIDRKGRNYTGFTCLQCGREQRLAAIAGGFRDCAAGDITYGWRDARCSRPAPAGAINSVRVTGPHIERVVGTCPNNPYAPIAVADGNGPGGVNTVRCVPVAGATYHYMLEKTGDPKLDGPFYMQPDPCNGRGRNPRHWA